MAPNFKYSTVILQKSKPTVCIFQKCKQTSVIFFSKCKQTAAIIIVTGFIIDAFGALRDQMQGVEDELTNNCFICGIGKDYLDGVPHGFDIHVQKEHNLANYL